MNINEVLGCYGTVF